MSVTSTELLPRNPPRRQRKSKNPNALPKTMLTLLGPAPASLPLKTLLRLTFLADREATERLGRSLTGTTWLRSSEDRPYSREAKAARDKLVQDGLIDVYHVQGRDGLMLMVHSKASRIRYRALLNQIPEDARLILHDVLMSVSDLDDIGIDACIQGHPSWQTTDWLDEVPLG